MNICSEMSPYFFDLPQDLIAQKPPTVRGASRLMLLDRRVAVNTSRRFEELPKLLPPGGLLVFNDVRVIPARLMGRRIITGGLVEALILAPPPLNIPPGDCDLWCLVHPGRRIKPGVELTFSRGGSSTTLTAEILKSDPAGKRLIRFHFTANPAKVLDDIGHIPLPFYIRRPDSDEDCERYQTVYGVTPGAVAAPTAGLHFTNLMLERLKLEGFKTTQVTLKISAGTFAPLTEEQLTVGRLHSEYIRVSEDAVRAIRVAKAEGRPVIAVGTTSARSLEWAAETGSIIPREGWSDLFIRPGYEFKVIDGLVTNFHLPASSLLMLTAALTGRKRILAAYTEAIAAGFRFYSYGDAMLII